MDDCTIILLGATGDLAKRKLIPALYRLLADKKVEKLLLIGAAREDLTTEQFIAQARSVVDASDESVWQKFAAHIVYQKVDALVEHDWQLLAQVVSAHELAGGFSGCRLLYAATASILFSAVTRYAASSGIIAPTHINDNIWQRIVYEKPFGRDARSAQEINAVIAAHFQEHQIYRIDHYLTKELVHNIIKLRFANAIFEPLWNAQSIEEVHIILSEEGGIPGRALFYDSYGAMRDVVQNHMLELLALIAMEPPERFYGDHVCQARANVLKQTHIFDGLLGQADAYKQEDGIAQDSHTETFALLRLVIENKRWQGVPFYLKTGKYLAKHETAIHLKFRKSAYAHLFGAVPEANWLSMKIAPDEIFSLYFNVKQPGHVHDLTSVALEFCHSCLFGPQTMYAYQTLFDEIIHGERSALVSKHEIEQAWRIVDDAYSKNLPLYVYQKGSDGPAQADSFAEQFQLRWRS